MTNVQIDRRSIDKLAVVGAKLAGIGFLVTLSLVLLFEFQADLPLFFIIPIGFIGLGGLVIAALIALIYGLVDFSFQVVKTSRWATKKQNWVELFCDLITVSKVLIALILVAMIAFVFLWLGASTFYVLASLPPSTLLAIIVIVVILKR